MLYTVEYPDLELRGVRELFGTTNADDHKINQSKFQDKRSELSVCNAKALDLPRFFSSDSNQQSDTSLNGRLHLKPFCFLS